MTSLSALHILEAEAIFIIREIVSEVQRPILLFSGGKDSVVLLHLAEKAFWPSRLPFPILHVDTGHNFPEILDFRDWRTKDHELIIASVPDFIAAGDIVDAPSGSRNKLQIYALLRALQGGKFDAALGGARRDEDKARAKERVFSFRDTLGQWNPRTQRPEPWKLYNGRIHPGESVRCFPLSNWTEMDIWQYIAQEGIILPSLYFSHHREVFERDSILLPVSPFLVLRPNESASVQQVRYRTIGDMTITGAVLSSASTAYDIIAEIALTRYSERGQTRADDKLSSAAMEERKREGYF